MSSGVQSRLIGKEGLLNVTNGVETDRIDDNRLTMYDQRPLNYYLHNYFNKDGCSTSIHPRMKLLDWLVDPTSRDYVTPSLTIFNLYSVTKKQFTFNDKKQSA